MTILTVDIDLAKNVFALHGLKEAGKADLVRPSVPREQLKATLAALLRMTDQLKGGLVAG